MASALFRDQGPDRRQPRRSVKPLASPSTPAWNQNHPVESELASRYCRQHHRDQRIERKTTTTTLAGEILSPAGKKVRWRQYRTPVIELVGQSSADRLECPRDLSFQLETIGGRFTPDRGHPEHHTRPLDRHRTFEIYSPRSTHFRKSNCSRSCGSECR